MADAAPQASARALASQRRSQLVEVTVLMLEHVGDGGADGAGRPAGPADGQVEVLFAHGEEGLSKALPCLGQLPTDPGQVPAAGEVGRPGRALDQPHRADVPSQGLTNADV